MAQGFTAFGSGATSAGKAMLPLSVAVAGVGVAAVKVGSDFDTSMSQVAATMGMTSEQVQNGCEDYEKLRQAAKDAGESTKFTAAQGGEALNYLALAGYDADKAIGALPTVLNLAAAGGLELGYASDMVTDSMSALGIETSELVGFSDELAKTSQKSNTNIAQLGEAIITVGGTAKNLAGGTVELNTALGILADNGIKGSDSGTALRQVILNLAAPTEKSAKFMKDFGLSAFDAEGNMKPLNETFQELDKKLEGMNDEERMNVLSNIFDVRQLKSAEALLANCGDRFTYLSGQIANADGATENMAETMGDNLQGQLTLLLSQIQGVAIQLTEMLMPSIRAIVEKISEWVEKFSKLDESTQKLILAVAGVVMVAGPLLIVIGKISTGVGAILSIASATSAGIGGLSTALAVLTGPVGIAVTAIAGLGIAGVTVYKHMSESAIPAINLFADKVSIASDGTKTLEQAISDSTEAAVGSYMDLEREAGESLSKMSSMVSANTEEQQALLTEYSSDIQQKYTEMKEMVVSNMEERQTEEMNLLKDGFAQSSSMTEEQEAEIAARLNDKQYEEKEAVSAHYAEINAIVANAASEKRGLTLAETEQIKAIQEEQKVNAVQVLSDSEIEARVILDRMKSYNETVSVEIAAKTIQDAEAARLAVVAEAEQKCIEEIAIAQRMKDELGIISQEEYDKMVADAQKKKTDIVAEAEAIKTATVNAMLAQNSELENAVDTSNGEILSKWDVFKNNTATKWGEISDSILETTQQIKESAVSEFSELGDDICNKLEAVKNFFKGCWDTISQIFSSAGKTIKDGTVKIFTELKTSIVNKFTEIKTALSTKMEEIKTSITTKFTEIVTVAKKLPSDIKQVGSDMIQGLIDGFMAKFEEAKAKEEAEAKKQALQEELEAKEYQLEQQRTTEINHMNAIIALMEAQVEKRKELEKVEADIVKNAEQQRTDELAREKEKQSDKAKTELDKQSEAIEEAKRQETIATGEELKQQKAALEKSITEGNALLQQKVESTVQAEQDITKAVIMETEKRNQVQEQDLFPAADGADNERGNPNIITVTEEQTEFVKEQWDTQTLYRQEKEQEQTLAFNNQIKAQSDYFLQQQQERTAVFNTALMAALEAFRTAAQNIQSIVYTCGQQIYEGIASTESEIDGYISRMVRKIKESLESASRSARGDFGGGDYDGSHRNGLDYVPFDDYRAILHKGEAVLTANENKKYNSTQTVVKQAPNVTVNQYISAPTADARQLERQAQRRFKKIPLEV